MLQIYKKISIPSVFFHLFLPNETQYKASVTNENVIFHNSH